MFEGGTCVEPGAPTCTHLVIDDRTTRTVPFELHGRVHVVKSEVSCLLCVPGSYIRDYWLVVWSCVIRLICYHEQ